MTRSIDPSPPDIPASFQALGLPPLIVQTLVRRGITTPEAAHAFLDPDFYPLASPYELPGMEAAVKRILLAIRNKECASFIRGYKFIYALDLLRHVTARLEPL